MNTYDEFLKESKMDNGELSRYLIIKYNNYKALDKELMFDCFENEEKELDYRSKNYEELVKAEPYNFIYGSNEEIFLLSYAFLIKLNYREKPLVAAKFLNYMHNSLQRIYKDLFAIYGNNKQMIYQDYKDDSLEGLEIQIYLKTIELIKDNKDYLKEFEYYDFEDAFNLFSKIEEIKSSK